jgi:hypothetical protein
MRRVATVSAAIVLATTGALAFTGCGGTETITTTVTSAEPNCDPTASAALSDPDACTGHLPSGEPCHASLPPWHGRDQAGCLADD